MLFEILKDRNSKNRNSKFTCPTKSGYGRGMGMGRMGGGNMGGGYRMMGGGMRMGGMSRGAF